MEVEARLMDEEDANATMAGATKKLAAEGEQQEKNTKETQIKSLQDEMAQQDELIAKLTREKKKVEENNRRRTPRRPRSSLSRTRWPNRTSSSPSSPARRRRSRRTTGEEHQGDPDQVSPGRDG